MKSSLEKKKGIYGILELSKDKLCNLSHRYENVDDVHLSLVDTGRIRQLLHYQKYLLDQELNPYDGSFRHISIALHYFDAFRAHPDDLVMLS